MDDFDGDCSDMLNMARDCIELHNKFLNYHQEVNAHLSVSKNKLQEAENKLLEMEQKSKILKKVSVLFTLQCMNQLFSQFELIMKKIKLLVTYMGEKKKPT